MSKDTAIGFDLDMTLIDSRPVSQRALERMKSEHGADLDIHSLMSAYGLPLSEWLPVDVDPALFRALQSQEISHTVAMPGAIAAVRAVRASGTRVVVVTAAPAEIATSMLEAVGLHAERLWADVWGSTKVGPLREERCWAFVGDHADDLSAAREAGAIAIGVRTGMSPPLGAEVELEDLTEFAAWLAEHKPPTH